MNVETLPVATQTPLEKEAVAVNATETAEITPMPMDRFNLVGGGSAIFLFD